MEPLADIRGTVSLALKLLEIAIGALQTRAEAIEILGDIRDPGLELTDIRLEHRFDGHLLLRERLGERRILGRPEILEIAQGPSHPPTDQEIASEAISVRRRFFSSEITSRCFSIVSESSWNVSGSRRSRTSRESSSGAPAASTKLQRKRYASARARGRSAGS